MLALMVPLSSATYSRNVVWSDWRTFHYDAAEKSPEKYRAQFNLGVMYRYGRGVSQSDIEAYAWFSVSTTNGYEDAEQFWSEVKAELTPEQLGTAEERATELFEQINANKAK